MSFSGTRNLDWTGHPLWNLDSELNTCESLTSQWKRFDFNTLTKVGQKQQLNMTEFYSL